MAARSGTSSGWPPTAVRPVRAVRRRNRTRDCRPPGCRDGSPRIRDQPRIGTTMPGASAPAPTRICPGAAARPGRRGSTAGAAATIRRAATSAMPGWHQGQAPRAPPAGGMALPARLAIREPSIPQPVLASRDPPTPAPGRQETPAPEPTARGRLTPGRLTQGRPIPGTRTLGGRTRAARAREAQTPVEQTPALAIRESAIRALVIHGREPGPTGHPERRRRTTHPVARSAPTARVIPAACPALPAGIPVYHATFRPVPAQAPHVPQTRARATPGPGTHAPQTRAYGPPTPATRASASGSAGQEPTGPAAACPAPACLVPACPIPACPAPAGPATRPHPTTRPADGPAPTPPATPPAHPDAAPAHPAPQEHPRPPTPGPSTPEPAPDHQEPADQEPATPGPLAASGPVMTSTPTRRSRSASRAAEGREPTCRAPAVRDGRRLARTRKAGDPHPAGQDARPAIPTTVRTADPTGTAWTPGRPAGVTRAGCEGRAGPTADRLPIARSGEPGLAMAGACRARIRSTCRSPGMQDCSATATG